MPRFSRTQDELGWTASSILIGPGGPRQKGNSFAVPRGIYPQSAGDPLSLNSGKRDAVIAGADEHIDKHASGVPKPSIIQSIVNYRVINLDRECRDTNNLRVIRGKGLSAT